MPNPAVLVWLLGLLSLSPPPSDASPSEAPAPTTAQAEAVAPINAVVGDASWVERYGHAPTPEEALERDEERHRVHLEWIERRLRAAPGGHLRPEQRKMRASLLDALAEYRRRGVHPVNDRAARLPRFLDPEGRICAVGYMIEASGDRALVERLNRRYEYDLLMEIDDPELKAWVERSGFAAEELASIQPTGISSFGLEYVLILGVPLVGAPAFIADISIFAAADYKRGRGFDPVAATFELLWGALHVMSLWGAVAFGGNAPAAAAGFAAIAGLGVAQMTHAIWSYTRIGVTPEEEDEGLSLRWGVGPAEGGALASLDGSF